MAVVCYLYYKFTDLFSSGCNPEQLNCGDGNCKPQYKSCKDDGRYGQDSDENNCCKYVFLATFQKMVGGRSRNIHILMVKSVVSRYFFWWHKVKVS